MAPLHPRRREPGFPAPGHDWGLAARSDGRARIDVVRRDRAISVHYVDARRFGRLLVAHRDIADWIGLGPDPLADGVDIRRLSERFAKSRRAVKIILMDQRVLAGVGNILATEALWIARLDPRSPGVALLPSDARAIARGLHRAIAWELADPAESFFIYGRTGKPCPRCGTRFSSVVLGGRTSVHCGGCQVRRKTTSKLVTQSAQAHGKT